MYLVCYAFLLGNKAECMYEVFGAGAPFLTVLLFIIYDKQRVWLAGKVTLTVKTITGLYTKARAIHVMTP